MTVRYSYMGDIPVLYQGQFGVTTMSLRTFLLLKGDNPNCPIDVIIDGEIKKAKIGECTNEKEVEIHFQALIAESNALKEETDNKRKQALTAA